MPSQRRMLPVVFASGRSGSGRRMRRRRHMSCCWRWSSADNIATRKKTTRNMTVSRTVAFPSVSWMKRHLAKEETLADCEVDSNAKPVGSVDAKLNELSSLSWFMQTSVAFFLSPPKRPTATRPLHSESSGAERVPPVCAMK
eukprot:scaffold64654_cov66-Phaeocystis_antarctica.AAC.3